MKLKLWEELLQPEVHEGEDQTGDRSDQVDDDPQEHLQEGQVFQEDGDNDDDVTEGKNQLQGRGHGREGRWTWRSSTSRSK